METIHFIPFDATYRIIKGKAVIMMFGRTVDNRQICVTYDAFKPYFYAIPVDNVDVIEGIKKIRAQKDNETISIEDIHPIKKKYIGKEIHALKVVCSLPTHVPILREEVRKVPGVKSVNEDDILFVRRFMIDNKIIPLVVYEIEGSYQQSSLRVPSFKAHSFKESSVERNYEPRILSIDIETYTPIRREIQPERNPVLMVALYGKDYRKVFVWKKFDIIMEDVEFAGDEKEMLQKMKDAIIHYQPDILCGYYSDGFDMPYLIARAEKWNVKLTLGLDDSEISTKKGIGDSCAITGIVHVDIFKFIKRVMHGILHSDQYGLNAVAFELLGEKKLEVDLDELSKQWDSNGNLTKYCEYNIHDAMLAYKLTEKLLPNLSELVKITGLLMFDVNRMGFSQLVEWYLLKEAPHYNQIAPNKPWHNELVLRRNTYIKGAFVFEPEPGLYKDIVVFDYLSLYPTIIGSHNLSSEFVNFGEAEHGGVQAPLDEKRIWFSQKEKGFLPLMIENIIKRRMQLKEALKHVSGHEKVILNARQYGLKLLANSFYGYLGFYGARWYSLEAAEATTAFGRYYIKQVIGKAQAEDYKVIYSDTDSVFLVLGSKTKNDALKFAEEINKDLPGLMELEFENYYPSGIFVSAKSGEFGAKKRYALISEEGNLKIRGFESVRRNTSPIAKEAQEEVFRIVLREHDKEKAFLYIRDILKSIKERKVPNAKMIITINLQKAIQDYDSKGPHVAVAERLKAKGIHVGPGSAISFIVTQGSDIIRNRSKFPEEVKEGDYDPDYYTHNQVIPAVERIFNVLGYEKEQLLSDGKQKTLAGFFS